MIGRLAITTGISGLLALILLILFFTIGGPFGTLNDIFNGLTGLLSGALAIGLSRQFHMGKIWLIFSSLGAVSAVIGSILVIYEITGWYLAGLYTSMGYALIGVWLLAFNHRARQVQDWPQGLIRLGLIAAIIMMLGLLMLPAIVNRIDAWELGPWYVNYIGQLGSFGYFLLYPLWCILVGRTLLQKQKDILQ